MSSSKLRQAPAAVTKEALNSLPTLPKIYDSFGFGTASNAVQGAVEYNTSLTTLRPKLQVTIANTSMSGQNLSVDGIDSARSEQGKSKNRAITLPPVSRLHTSQSSRSNHNSKGRIGRAGLNSPQRGAGDSKLGVNFEMESPAQRRVLILQRLGINLPIGARPDPELEEFLRLVESETLPADELRWRYNLFRVKYRSKEEEVETSQYYSLIQDSITRISECMATYEHARREEDGADQDEADDGLKKDKAFYDTSATAPDTESPTSEYSLPKKKEDPFTILREKIDDEIDRLLQAEKQRREENEALVEGVTATIEDAEQSSKLDEKLLNMTDIEQHALSQQLQVVRLTVDESNRSANTKLRSQLDRLQMLIKRLKYDESRYREFGVDRAALAAVLGNASGSSSQGPGGARGSFSSLGVSLDAAVLAQMRQQLRERDQRILQLEDLIRKLGAIVPPSTFNIGGDILGSPATSRVGSAAKGGDASNGLPSPNDADTSSITGSNAAEAVALARIQDLERRNQSLKVEVDRLAGRLREFKNISGAGDIVRELEKELEYQRQRSKEAEIAQGQLDKLIAMRTTTVQQNHVLTRRNAEIERRNKELEVKLRDISLRTKEEAVASAAATAAALVAAGAGPDTVSGTASNSGSMSGANVNALQNLHAQNQELSKVISEQSEEIQRLQSSIATHEEELNVLRSERENFAHVLMGGAEEKSPVTAQTTKGVKETQNNKMFTSSNKTVEAVGVKGNAIKCGKCNTFVTVPSSFKMPTAGPSSSNDPRKAAPNHSAAQEKKDERERLEKERDKERREKEDLKAELETLKVKTSSASAAASMFSAKEKQLQDQLQAAQLQKAALQRVSQAHEKQADECKRIAEQAEKSAETAKKEAELANKSLGSLQLEIESFTERQADLLSKIVMMQKAEELHTDAVRKLRAVNDELQVVRQRDKTTLAQAKSQVSMLEKALADATKQLEMAAKMSSASDSAAASALSEQARALREEQAKISEQLASQSSGENQGIENGEECVEGAGGIQIDLTDEEAEMNKALEAAANAAAASLNAEAKLAEVDVVTSVMDGNDDTKYTTSSRPSSQLGVNSAEDALGAELLERLAQLAKNQAVVSGMKTGQIEAKGDLVRLQKEFQNVQTMLSQYTAERALLQQRLGNALGALQDERGANSATSKPPERLDSEDSTGQSVVADRGVSLSEDTVNVTAETRLLRREVSELEVENAKLKAKIVEFEAKALTQDEEDDKLGDSTMNTEAQMRIGKLEEEVEGLRWLVEKREEEAHEKERQEKQWKMKYEDIKSRYDALLVRYKELDELKGQGLKLDPSVIGMSPEEILRSFASAALSYKQRRKSGASDAGDLLSDDEVLLSAAEGVKHMVDEVRAREATRARSSVLKPWPSAGTPSSNLEVGPSEAELQGLSVTGSSAAPSRSASPIAQSRQQAILSPGSPTRVPSRSSLRLQSQTDAVNAPSTPKQQPSSSPASPAISSTSVPTPPSQVKFFDGEPPKPTTYSAALDALTRNGSGSSAAAAAAAYASSASSHGNQASGMFSVSGVFASRRHQLEKKELEPLIAGDHSVELPNESGWDRVLPSSTDAAMGPDSLVKLYGLQLTNQFDP